MPTPGSEPVVSRRDQYLKDLESKSEYADYVQRAKKFIADDVNITPEQLFEKLNNGYQAGANQRLSALVASKQYTQEAVDKYLKDNPRDPSKDPYVQEDDIIKGLNKSLEASDKERNKDAAVRGEHAAVLKRVGEEERAFQTAKITLLNESTGLNSIRSQPELIKFTLRLAALEIAEFQGKKEPDADDWGKAKTWIAKQFETDRPQGVAQVKTFLEELAQRSFGAVAQKFNWDTKDGLTRWNDQKLAEWTESVIAKSNSLKIPEGLSEDLLKSVSAVQPKPNITITGKLREYDGRFYVRDSKTKKDYEVDSTSYEEFTGRGIEGNVGNKVTVSGIAGEEINRPFDGSRGWGFSAAAKLWSLGTLYLVDKSLDLGHKLRAPKSKRTPLELSPDGLSIVR